MREVPLRRRRPAARVLRYLGAHEVRPRHQVLRRRLVGVAHGGVAVRAPRTPRARRALPPRATAAQTVVQRRRVSRARRDMRRVSVVRERGLPAIHRKRPGRHGICSALCSSDAECGSAGACIPVPVLDGGACYPTCSAAADCAGGFRASGIRRSTGASASRCRPRSARQTRHPGTCQACLGMSCCSQVTACAEDVACSKLESACAGNAACASTLQASGNAAAQASGLVRGRELRHRLSVTGARRARSGRGQAG